MYRASDEVEHQQYLDELDTAADRLDLGTTARSRAADLFLTTVPEAERSKRATLATALYAGALLAGEERTQGEVARATEVSRLTIQQRWKDLIDRVGLDAPDW